MNAFYEVINGLYSNDMLKVIHTLNKYSLCHVEEVDGINQEAIHTGFYFLTRNDKLCEVYYLVNEKNYVFKVSLIKAGIYVLLAAVIIEYKLIMKMSFA